jgi:hypothetical protein
MRNGASATAPAGATEAAALPDVVVRFPAMYAWGVIGFGGVFFLLGLCFALLNRRNLGLGVFLSTTSLAAMAGATYWLRHLHVVARLTPRQLILWRDGSVNWDEIVAIKSVEIRASYRGTPTRSRFVCVALKNRPAPKNRLDAFMRKAKHGITGYDIILGKSEMSCSADWLVAECQKRMAAAGTLCTGDLPPSTEYPTAA